MTDRNYIRDFQPILHSCAEMHARGGMKLTAGELKVYWVKVQALQKALLSVAEFQLEHAEMTQAINSLLEERKPSDDVDPNHN